MINIIETISAAIGYIIFAGSIIVYVSNLYQQPFDKISAIGLAAFALLAAISGLCFAMASVMKEDNDKTITIYSGEKLLHSSVLVVETIVLKYVASTALALPYMKSHTILSSIFSWLFAALLFVISIYAAYFALYGLEALHDLLWNRFNMRQPITKKEQENKKL